MLSSSGSGLSQQGKHSSCCTIARDWVTVTHSLHLLSHFQISTRHYNNNSYPILKLFCHLMKLTTDSLSLFINSLYLTPEKYFLCKAFIVPSFLLLRPAQTVQI